MSRRMTIMSNASYVSAEEALSRIQNGDRIFIQGSGATPLHLLDALDRRAAELEDIELLAISTYGGKIFQRADFHDHFFVNSLFVSPNIRHLVNSDAGDYVPVFLSEIPRLFATEILPIDVALIHVSPPDRHGFCTLGVSVDVTRSALRYAEYVVAQVNSKMPRTHGDGLVHVNQIDALVESHDDLIEVTYANKRTESTDQIGKLCAELIEDGSTLQMGIGGVPDSVLASLGSHKDLGIHSEMISDGILPLVRAGVITNKYKSKHQDKIVSGFAFGTRELYDFVDDNPQVVLLNSDYVNDTKNIRDNPKAVAINSALEIDLTGQICSDSLGTYQYSGVGGQMDFMRGAALSEGGKPIIAMPSVTKKGTTKIVPLLRPGAGVVTTRAHVHYVVTEYGVVNLNGKNLRQRAEALRDIAHPDHRESLDKEIFQRFKGKTMRPD